MGTMDVKQPPPIVVIVSGYGSVACSNSLIMELSRRASPGDNDLDNSSIGPPVDSFIIYCFRDSAMNIYRKEMAFFFPRFYGPGWMQRRHLDVQLKTSHTQWKLL